MLSYSFGGIVGIGLSRFVPIIGSFGLIASPRWTAGSGLGSAVVGNIGFAWIKTRSLLSLTWFVGIVFIPFL